MNVLERQRVMNILEAMFDKDGIVSRDDAERITGLSEKSIADAYYLEKADCLVKLNTYGIPAACSSFTHTSYVRIKDMSKKQVVAYSRWLAEHKDGTILSDDIALKQLDDRKDSLLGSDD